MTADDRVGKNQPLLVSDSGQQHEQMENTPPRRDRLLFDNAAIPDISSYHVALERILQI